MSNALALGAVRLLSPSIMGRANRSRVLQVLLRNGPTSRAQLARDLGVTRATIATILQPLIDDHTLVEGAATSTSPAGGKPARPLWFNETGPELGSIRISSEWIATARLGMDGSVRHQARWPVDAQWGQQRVREQLLDAARAEFGGRELVGIGVATAGLVNTTTGEILSVHLAPALGGLPVSSLLAEVFGVPVALDHHPRVLALGDMWFGLGKRLQHFASVYTGEALGMGFVHEGEVYRGPHGAGGEGGHVVVDAHGELCNCGRRGCWETLATTTWLRREARAAGLEDADLLDCSRLVARAADDRRAEQLLHTYASNVALGIANHEHLLGSGTYIIHGDVAGGGEVMNELLSREVRRMSPSRKPLPTVLFDHTGEDTVLRGGGGLVLSRELVTTA